MYTEINDYLKTNLSEKRYGHTIEVVKECMYYANVFELSKADSDKLYRAALFHDITKEKNPEEQINLCRVYHIEYDEGYIATPSLFHAKTGGKYAAELFPAYCDDDIISIISTHTTGAPKMNLLQKILFLADSTEATRTHKSCIDLRNYFHNNTERIQKYDLINQALVKSLNNTISYLITTDTPIHVDTILTRNSLLKNEVKYEKQ